MALALFPKTRLEALNKRARSVKGLVKVANTFQ